MNSGTEILRQKGFLCLGNDRPVTQTRLVELASTFGPVLETERHTGEFPCIQVISNEGLFGCDEVPWHNDWSYGPGDYHGTLLYNRKDGHRALTYFCDMEDACARLPAADRDRFRRLRGHYYPPGNLHDSCFTARQLRLLRRAAVSRPLVFDHPATGRPVLYFSPGTLTKITDEAGEPVEIDVAGLIEHCEAGMWPHAWRPDDILLYDNRRVMHRRNGFEGRRELWRVQFGESKVLPSGQYGVLISSGAIS